MRKLSLLGGLALSLVVGSSAFAASPSVPVASSHVYRTSFHDATLTVRSTLTASSTYSSGKLYVHIVGATAGEKIAIRFFDRSGTKVQHLITRTVTANSKGVYSATWKLGATALADLKSLGSTATRDLQTTAARHTVTGILLAV